VLCFRGVGSQGGCVVRPLGRYQLTLPLPFTPGMDAGVVRSAPAGITGYHR
jgi:hypothetical protein